MPKSKGCDSQSGVCRYTNKCVRLVNANELKSNSDVQNEADLKSAIRSFVKKKTFGLSA